MIDYMKDIPLYIQNWNKVYADKKLNGADHAVLGFVKFHEGRNKVIWYAYDKLAEGVGRSLITVKRSVRTLLDLKYLVQDGNGKNGVVRIGLNPGLREYQTSITIDTPKQYQKRYTNVLKKKYNKKTHDSLRKESFVDTPYQENSLSEKSKSQTNKDKAQDNLTNNACRITIDTPLASKCATEEAKVRAILASAYPETLNIVKLEIEEVIEKYGNAYQTHYDNPHPFLVREQTKRITDVLCAFGYEKEVLLEDWNAMIVYYFSDPARKSNGNLNAFANFKTLHYLWDKAPRKPEEAVIPVQPPEKLEEEDWDSMPF